MLNFIWLGLIVLAVLIGGFHGELGPVGDAAVDKAKYAVYPLGTTLLAVMTLWLGLMRLAEKAGLIHRLGLALRPILRFLFPDVPPDHPALGAIVLNVSANILGLNNAATPLGLRAMSELDTLNPRPGVASNAMCMLLAINTSSITLIPVTAIGFLVAAKGRDPFVIIGTSLAATAITQLCAIGTCKLLERTSWSRRQLEAVPISRAVGAGPGKAGSEGGEVQASAERADETLPWVPGSRWILAAFLGIFIGVTLAFGFPEINGVAPPPDAARHWWPIRLVNQLSSEVLPWLIMLFPLYAMLRRIPVYDQFVEGGKEAVQVILRILPYLVGMLVAVGMFSAAGGMDLVKVVLSPVTNLFGFPADLVPMAVIRPFSSAAAQGLLADVIQKHGPDDLVTLMAATFYGCSETTFYVIAVYFGSVGIKISRHAIVTGLIADTIQPISAVLICRALLG